MLHGSEYSPSKRRKAGPRLVLAYIGSGPLSSPGSGPAEACRGGARDQRYVVEP